MRLLAFCLFTAFLLPASASPAFACAIEPSSGFKNLISLASWVGGASLALAAFFHFRAARRNAKDGKWDRARVRAGYYRLIFGVMLAVFPFIHQALNSSSIGVTPEMWQPPEIRPPVPEVRPPVPEVRPPVPEGRTPAKPE